jgi:uncharacterized YigZ family protein
MSVSGVFTTVRSESQIEYEEKRSIFISRALRVDSEEEALEFIASIKKQHRDATHNVFAYHINKGVIARYSDDGEPQGTSGMPTLETIRKKGVDNVCVVTTRYFGGILLGAGGLVRAYSHAAALAIDEAQIITYEPYDEYEIVCSYSDYQKYNSYFSDIGLIIDSTDFAENVTVRFAVKSNLSQRIEEKIVEIGNARSKLEKKGERYDYR